MLMTKELQVFNNEVFGTMRIVDVDGKPYMVAQDIAKALGYVRPRDAIAAHCKGAVKHRILTNGGNQDITVIPQGDIYRLIVRSKLPNAEKFESWVFDEVIPSVVNTGHYETAEYKAILELKEGQEQLKKLLIDSGVLRTGVSDRHTFDRLNVRYKIATGDDGHRGFYDAIGNYFGITVPYSTAIKVTVKDWIIAKVDMDELQQFVLGIESAMIIKSVKGFYVNLHGFGGNNIEWQKILDHWDNSCAYCGCGDKALIPEHIISQSYLSQSNPEAVDLIGNITCSCGICNKAKGTLDVDEFFDNNPQLKRWRLDKIHRWQSKHRIEV